MLICLYFRRHHGPSRLLKDPVQIWGLGWYDRVLGCQLIRTPHNKPWTSKRFSSRSEIFGGLLCLSQEGRHLIESHPESLALIMVGGFHHTAFI